MKDGDRGSRDFMEEIGKRSKNTKSQDDNWRCKLNQAAGACVPMTVLRRVIPADEKGSRVRKCSRCRRERGEANLRRAPPRARLCYEGALVVCFYMFSYILLNDSAGTIGLQFDKAPDRSVRNLSNFAQAEVDAQRFLFYSINALLSCGTLRNEGSRLKGAKLELEAVIQWSLCEEGLKFDLT